MPLSQPVPREEMHARRISCRGFRREDGLWDIEAELLDEKTHPMPNVERGHIPAGATIHGMKIRVTIDRAALIHEAEVAMDDVPFTVCGAVAPDFKALKGLTIGPGFLRAVRERFGGTKGCTHVVDLLRPLAVVAWQTLLPFSLEDGEEIASRAFDTCHALAVDGPMVARHWPEFRRVPSGSE